MASLETEYDSDLNSITITLASLADGGYRQSAVVDNSSDKFIDAMVGGTIRTGTSPTAGDEIIVSAYAIAEGTHASPVYTGGCSGSDDGYIAGGEEGLLRRLVLIQVDGTTDQDYVFGPVSVAAAFSGVLPYKWGIMVQNESGAALDSTGHTVKFEGVKFEDV